MVMGRRYKDHEPKPDGKAKRLARIVAVVALLFAGVALHATVTALNEGRDDWWLGVVAILGIALTAASMAGLWRQSNAG